MKKFTAIVLAAGKGVRMKLPYPKVLSDLGGKPLIYYVLKELLTLKSFIKQIVIVVGYQGQKVRKQIESDPCIMDLSKKNKVKIDFVYQNKMQGTADAVRVSKLKVKNNNILVVCGDTPLIRSKTLSKFIRFYLNKKLSCAVLTASIKGNESLGAIVRDTYGKIEGIREKSDSTPGNRGDALSRPKSEEVNSGIYCFQKGILFKNLKKIRRNKKKREFFLTDIVGILYRGGYSMGTHLLSSGDEILGINNRRDYYKASKIMRYRVLDSHIDRGIVIIDPDTTFIQDGVSIGKNTVIYPFTFIEKGVIIGRNCSLGPFIRLRGESIIKDNSEVGNFLEVNRSKVGKGSRIKHFAYLGDAYLAENVNIGAGCVFANYDGKNKNNTYIGKGSFIGSDTVLVAPVKVGKGAVTGAGSVVKKDVKPKTVVVGVPAKELKKAKR